MEEKYAKRLKKHDNLTSVLIQIEDILDSNDIYVFKNWEEGEIHAGPDIKRYWVDVSLLYKYCDMPDPRGAERLSSLGIKIRYEKIEIDMPVKIKTKDDVDPANRGKPKFKKETFWLIHMSIPRKFIEELDDDDLQSYDDDEAETDAVSDARDDNIDAEDEFMDAEPDDDVAAGDEGDDEEA